MFIFMICVVFFDFDDIFMDYIFVMYVGLDEWCVELGVVQGQYVCFFVFECKWFSVYECGEVMYQG